MAREDGKPERTVKRKDKFKQLYKNIRDVEPDWKKEMEETDEQKFQSKKLYLYYTQRGKSMYTGKAITIDELFTDKYDIDHIYPRSVKKDDSLENNLVLVEKKVNEDKSDIYPLSPEIQQKNFAYWKDLLDHELITKEKYYRLVRTTGFTDDELADFINRQLVETRQGTKALAHILESVFKTSSIVYVKAGNVSDFRQKFDLLKNREINNFHHANDAYLNIVVGNTYDTKFTQNPHIFIKEFRKNQKKYHYHLGKLFESSVERNGLVAWNTKNDKSISIVKKTMSKNSPLVTKRTYINKGKLSDELIVKATSNDGTKMPIKRNDKRLLDVSKYGSYNSIKTSYFFVVSHKNKNVRIKTIEFVSVEFEPMIKKEKDLIDYCINYLHLIEPRIIIKRININTTISVDGFRYYLSGRTGNRLAINSAEEAYIDYTHSLQIRNLVKYSENEDYIDEMKDLYSYLCDILSRNPYDRKKNPIIKTLRDGEEMFGELNLQQQKSVISAIVSYVGGNNNGINLSLVGGSTKQGKALLGSTLNNDNHIELIYTSPTGLFNKIVNIDEL